MRSLGMTQPALPAAPIEMLGLADAAGVSAPANRAQVEQAAHGFESMFASMLIKQMRQTLEPDTLFGKDSGDVLGGLFDSYLGQHLAQAGGLGIAALVRQQLTPPRRT